MHMLSYVAAVLEIILFFDLLRRVDQLKPLPDQDEDSIIKLESLQRKKEKKEKEIGA